VVVTGQKDVNRGSIAGDGPLEVAVKGAGRNRTRKRDTSNPQLSGAIRLTMMLALAPESMKVARAWEPSGRRGGTRWGPAHQYLPFYW